MIVSSSRFRSIAITIGLSFWFFIIMSSLGQFKIEYFAIFVASTLIVTQVFSSKLANVLETFAIINTKIFLGIVFVLVISLYGILFRLLGINLLRLKKQDSSYWLKIEEFTPSTIFKQY